MVMPIETLPAQVSELARDTAVRLSAANGRFLDYAEGHQELFERKTFARVNKNLNDVQPFALHGWPTFLSAAVQAELHRVNSGITRLVTEMPNRFFGLDPEAIANFYGLEIPEAATITRLLAVPHVAAGLLARGDYYFTEAGFQCLECNLTGNLGGAGTDVMAEQCLAVPELKEFFSSTNTPIIIRDTIHLGLTHAVRHTLASVPCPGGRVNLVHLTPPAARLADNGVVDYVRFKYSQAVKAAGAHPESQVFLVPYSGISVQNGKVVCEGAPVQAVIEGYLDKYPIAVTEAAIDGQVALFNGPTHKILDDKRNIAWLSAAADAGQLSPEEIDLVQKHIPWARVVDGGTTCYQGRDQVFSDLLREHGDAFVLKPAKGMGGEGITIGAYSSEGDWSAAVDRAVADPGQWIVQERVDSLPAPYQYGEVGCVDHAVVWGPFSIGDEYCGGFLRVQPIGGRKPVNESLGALMSVIYESED